MTQDPSHFLNELPIWKLKLIASEFKIDASGCKYKRDFVEKIKSKKLTEEQVRNVLAKGRREGPEEAQEVRTTVAEVEEIASRPAEPTELPTDEKARVERNIDEALTMKPLFFEVDSTNENALNKMILGDYAGAIKVNREARMRCLDNFSQFQVYSAAVSVRAADELISKLPDDKGKLEPRLRTALAAAKRAFISGSPRQREEALESLETLATKAFEAYISESESEESELRELLADYESFGTRTEEARRYLEIAAGARQAFNFAEHKKYVQEAKVHADNAKELRKTEIDNIFPLVHAAAEEAREVGVEVSQAEAQLEDAKKAFHGGSFRHAVELLAAIERQVDDAHLEQIGRQKELEARQLEKTKAYLATYEPALQEGVSYGFNLHEGLYHAANARAALARKDTVNAVKFTRRVKDIAVAAEKDLDKKRVELGVIKRVEDAKCGKCGKEALYVYPNASQKCLECGHSFSFAPTPEAVEEARPTPLQEPVLAPQPVEAKAAEPAPQPQAVQQPEAAQQTETKKRRRLKW